MPPIIGNNYPATPVADPSKVELAISTKFTPNPQVPSIKTSFYRQLSRIKLHQRSWPKHSGEAPQKGFGVSYWGEKNKR